MRTTPFILAAMIAVTTLGTPKTRAAVIIRIADVTKLKGYGVNHLVGTGLVVGLNGTGDGDAYEATMRALAQTLGGLAAPVSGLEELKDTSNVALVLLDAVIPEHGVREGDLIDVHVSAIGSAKSLAGGRLIASPLVFRDLEVPQVFAFASGGIHLADQTVPTVGIVERGALINEDVLVGFTATGSELPFSNDWIQPEQVYLTYVLEEAHAGWGLAVAIEEAINSELSKAADVERVAVAADPKNVIVWVPPFQRGNVASWIRDIEELSTLMPVAEARITIDRATGTIVVSGSAQISPVAISHKGMTINVNALKKPAGGPEDAAAPNTEPPDSTSLAELLQALNQLSVSAEDKIAILTQIQRAGKLHAKLVFKD